MKKPVIITVVVVIAALIIWLVFFKKKNSTNSKTDSTLEIPEKVQQNLDGFGEGEKMRFEGKEYVVLNGTWVALTA